MHTCGHHSILLPLGAPHATKQLYQGPLCMQEALLLHGDGITKGSVRHMHLVLPPAPRNQQQCCECPLCLAGSAARALFSQPQPLTGNQTEQQGEPPPSPSEEPGFSHLPCLGEDGKPSGFSFHQKSRLASPFTTGATQKIGISSSLLSSGQHLSVLADNRTVLLSYCLTVLLSANTMQTHPFYNFAVNTEHAMKNQWTFK